MAGHRRKQSYPSQSIPEIHGRIMGTIELNPCKLVVSGALNPIADSFREQGFNQSIPDEPIESGSKASHRPADISTAWFPDLIDRLNPIQIFDIIPNS
jgi:hypothetical protein